MLCISIKVLDIQACYSACDTENVSVARALMENCDRIKCAYGWSGQSSYAYNLNWGIPSFDVGLSYYCKYTRDDNQINSEPLEIICKPKLHSYKSKS